MTDHETVRGKIQRSDAVLMAMATCRRGTLFERVRLQLLLFLIDREIPDAVDGPHFRFRPDRYGPFDPAVFEILDDLAEEGHASIHADETWRACALTESGLEAGAKVLRRLPPETRAYLTEAARWVLSLRFLRLLAALGDRYPDIATETVASDVTRRFEPTGLPWPRQPFLEGAASVFDLAQALEPIRPTPAAPMPSDAEALAEDWRAVGDDMRNAMARFATQP